MAVCDYKGCTIIFVIIQYNISVNFIIVYRCVLRLTSDKSSLTPVETGGNNNGESDTFTLTGIPSTHNGKYAYITVSGEGVSVLGYQSMNMSTGKPELCLISNGSVNIPLWSGNNRYSGNNTGHATVSDTEFV
jgi:hypothetical protein